MRFSGQAIPEARHHSNREKSHIYQKTSSSKQGRFSKPKENSQVEFYSRNVSNLRTDWIKRYEAMTISGTNEF